MKCCERLAQCHYLKEMRPQATLRGCTLGTVRRNQRPLWVTSGTVTNGVEPIELFAG